MSVPLHYAWVKTTAGHALLTSRVPDKVADTLLIVPPFAEEMNRCRRLLTGTAIALAKHNIATHIVDVPGTGDSPVPFADARWEDWVSALIDVAAHMACDLRVLGVRLGAVLAVEALSGQWPVLAIHPVDGRSQRRQLLRARLLAGTENAEATTMAALENIWASGSALNLAGYDINPELARALDQALIPDPLPSHVSCRDLVVEGMAPWAQVEPEAPAAYVAAIVEIVLNWVAA